MMQHKIWTILSKKLKTVNHFHAISVGTNYDAHTPCVIHASKLKQGNVNSCVVPFSIKNWAACKGLEIVHNRHVGHALARGLTMSKKCAKIFDFR